VSIESAGTKIEVFIKGKGADAVEVLFHAIFSSPLEAESRSTSPSLSRPVG